MSLNVVFHARFKERTRIYKWASLSGDYSKFVILIKSSRRSGSKTY